MAFERGKSVHRSRISMNIAGGGTLSMNFLSTFHFWPWASLTGSAHLVQGEPSSNTRSTLFIIGMIFFVCLVWRVEVDWIVLDVKIMNNGERDGLPFSFAIFHFRTQLWLHAPVSAEPTFRFQNHRFMDITHQKCHCIVHCRLLECNSMQSKITKQPIAIHCSAKPIPDQCSGRIASLLSLNCS